MKKEKVLFILLPLLISTIFFSCSENPVGPAIKHIWGTSDYFPYTLYTNWKYQVDVPADTSQFELWHYVFGKEYIQPDSGWQVAIIVNSIPTGSYLLVAERLDGIYRFTNESGWWLVYELPYVVGSKWNSESIYLDSVMGQVKQEIDAEVLSREEVDVVAGTYEDCIKLRCDVLVSIVDTAGNDSSYYYKQYEWYAPDVGLVKWRIFDSDIEGMVGERGLLKRKFSGPFGGASGRKKGTLLEYSISNMARRLLF